MLRAAVSLPSRRHFGAKLPGKIYLWCFEYMLVGNVKRVKSNWNLQFVDILPEIFIWSFIKKEIQKAYFSEYESPLSTQMSSI